MGTNVELNERAESLMRDERWADAVALIQSQESYETDFELSWNLGWAYFKLGDYLAAERHLAKATQLTPMSAIAWWALGLVRRENGLLDEAERNLKHALILEDSSSARSALAITLMQLGRRIEAEQIHLEGLKLQPELHRRWRAYACYLEDVGRMQEAQAAYKKARFFEGA